MRELFSLIRQRATLPMLCVLLLMLVTHAPALPLFGWPVLLLCGAARGLPYRRWTSALRIVALLVVYFSSALVWGWLASDTLRLTLLAVLLLKWAESRSAAEDALVVAAALVAIAIGSLNWNEGWSLLWIVSGLVGALRALSVSSAPTPAARMGTNAPSLLARLRRGIAVYAMPLRHLAMALPLAGVLFVFFPRIPGPLWDIGLSFGLPLAVSIDQSPQGLGVSTSLKPGQTQTGADMASATPVLVAEFDNWVPPTSMLYWRGPVFYDFDGEHWQLNSDIATNGRRFMSEGWRSARSFNEETLTHKAQQVRYTIRLSPHKSTWLYALDLPAALPTESLVGPDWQVISHRPVEQEMTYAVSSWLEWAAKPAISAEVRTRALALPEQGNPRLRRLGEELRAQNAGKDGTNDTSATNAIMRAAMTRIIDGGFMAREVFDAPQGADAFDTFWFDTRTGNSEFFAGAFVYLMRAAGVPARLVTGYRGGKLMALTNYVVVKRSHAHAWAEIWDDEKGWQRVDPIDIVTLQKRTETGPKAKERTEPAQAAPAPQQNKSPQAERRPAPEGNFAERTPAARIRFDPSEEKPSLLDAISQWINHWVVRLDADRQLELLAGKGGGFAWVWLLLGAVFTSATIAMTGIGLSRWRDARRLAPAERAWQRASAALSRQGLAPLPTECPQTYARRIGSLRPEIAVGVTKLVEAYSGWRYGRHPARWAEAVAQATRYLINLIEAQPVRKAASKPAEPGPDTPLKKTEKEIDQ